MIGPDADDPRPAARTDDAGGAEGYEAPTLTRLGSLAELTLKTVGAADGETFLTLDIGSI